MAESGEPEKFTHDGKEYLARAPKTFRNNNTAWWDASQIYGYDERSRKRVKRDPADRAKLLHARRPAARRSTPQRPDQSASGPAGSHRVSRQLDHRDELLHNVFVREHNAFVDEFRRLAAQTPDARFGPAQSGEARRVIRYKDVTPDELFEAARLVVAAEIAKIHTIEWTPQLLYDEPLYRGMNANWSGLLGGPLGDNKAVADALSQIVTQELRQVDGCEEVGRSGIRCSRPAPAFSGWAARCMPTTRSSRRWIRTRRISGTYAIRTT